MIYIYTINILESEMFSWKQGKKGRRWEAKFVFHS